MLSCWWSLKALPAAAAIFSICNLSWWAYRAKAPEAVERPCSMCQSLAFFTQQLKNGHVVARRRLEAVEPSSHLAALPSSEAKGMSCSTLLVQLLNRQKPLPPIMAEYLDHREEKLAQITRVLFHKLPEARRRSVAKELTIALGFGGGFAKNEFLMSSSTDPRRCRVM